MVTAWKTRQLLCLLTLSVYLPQDILTHDIVEQMYSADISSAEHEAILTPQNDAAFDINDKLL